ncbi:DUF3040 domain-containing protein [Actinosynnema sp. NPDC059335]|uniref:DUF3040 domain-containing protein n=1 Tax=Actinosynnema sp. NPDC059335 TaxID=3346804 RepID=UPI003670BF4A
MEWWITAPATALAVGLLGVGHAERRRCRAQLFHHHRIRVAPRAVHAAVRTEPIMLSDHEQRRLRAIEEQLANEDPEFAERIRAFDRPDPRPAAGRLTPVVVFGLILVLIGAVADPGLVAIGLLIAAPAMGIRLLLSPPRRPHPPAGPDDDQPPPTSNRGAPV